MSVTLKQIDGAQVQPVDDARLYNLLLNNQVGIVEGCEITHLGANQLLISSGWGVCYGRVFVVAQETINANVSGGDIVSGRLILHIDIAADTPAVFQTQAATSLPGLIQEDINDSGTIYEIELARYNVEGIALSEIVSVYNTIVPPGDKAKNADNATNADNGIFTYVHTKSGTVHNLAGSGENIKFIAAADWNEGDSLTINGKVTHCLNNLFERVEGEVLFKQYAYVTATMRALTDYNRCFFKQGGAGMNFKIVGGTTQPASPKENTIWVNTDVAIGEYQFSSAEPTARADGTDLQTGDVWIRIGTSSNAEFNAVKKNSIYIYPQSCLQWDGTQFVSKEMKVYKNGEWTDTLVYLLLNGVAGEDTGGFSVLTPSSTPSRGNYGFNLSSSGLKNAANGENQLNSTGTIEKFNATGMSTLYVEYTVSGVSKEYWFAFGLSANRNVYWSNYNSFSSQPWAAYNSYHKKAAGKYVDAIDISNLNGKHYFNACLLISGDYATCTLNITKIWMV